MIVFLYVLSIIYTMLIMSFVGHSFMASAITKYLYDEFEPSVNYLFDKQSLNKIVFWESFIRHERANYISSALNSFGSFGQLVLIIFPCLIFLLAAQNFMLPNAFQPYLTPLERLIMALLPVIAWGMFILSMIGVTLVVAFNFFRARWSVK